jgi:hypothetical protein
MSEKEEDILKEINSIDAFRKTLHPILCKEISNRTYSSDFNNNEPDSTTKEKRVIEKKENYQAIESPSMLSALFKLQQIRV